MSDPANDEKPADETKGKAPEFDGDFDAEKATRLVANLREEVATLKGERDSLKTERDEFKAAAEKTGTERDDALAAAVKRAEDAERTLAISKHNLPDDVVEEFADYLTGTPEEVDAKAARLAARLAPKPEEPSGDSEPEGDEAGDEQKPALPGKPKPALTPGSGAEDDDLDFDAAAIAAATRR